MSEDLLRPPRGVRDIAGAEAELYEHLMEEFRREARLHGFKPVIPPTIEYSRLFEAKSGEEIKRSMYVFKDKAGRSIALRPEVTASIVRMYLHRMRGEAKPIRLYYIAQCFRYEEPQRGRYREFWQAGLEIIGDRDVNSDVAVAIAASSFLDRIGLKHYYVVGNVSFHRAVLSAANVPVEVQDYVLHLIDKGEIDRAVETLRGGVSEEHVEAFERVVSTSLDKLEEFLDEYRDRLKHFIGSLSEEASKTRAFIDTLKQLGYAVSYDPRLVRGLAYYTGLIYEYKVLEGELKVSIGGGGRYDNLTEVYGGSPEYSTGLALGLDRVALAIGEGSSRLKELVSSASGQILIVSLNDTPLEYSYRVLRALCNAGIGAWIYRTNSVGKGLSIANKRKAPLAIIIGRREYEDNKVSVKDMETQEQETLEVSKAIEAIKGALGSKRK